MQNDAATNGVYLVHSQFMRSKDSGLILGLLGMVLLHSPAVGQSFGPAAWIRQSWTGGDTFVPMDIAVGPNEEVFVTGHLVSGRQAHFEAGRSDSLEVWRLDVPVGNRGFLVRYDGSDGELRVMRPGSVISGAEYGHLGSTSDYSAGYSIDVVGDRVFHGEGSRLRTRYTTGSAMVTVRDLEGTPLYRFGPRERRFVGRSVFIQGIRFDTQGNVYIAGTMTSTLYFSPEIVLVPSGYSMYPFLASYTPDGVVRWAQQLPGTSTLWISTGRYGDEAIDVDQYGNVVLGAQFMGELTPTFSSVEDGVVLFHYASNRTLARFRTLKDLDVSYEPSFSRLVNDFGLDRHLARYYVPRPRFTRHDNSGNLYVVWEKSAWGIANSITVGDTTLFGRINRRFSILTKFDAQGNPLWARSYKYLQWLAPKGIAITEEGHVYIYGEFSGPFLWIEGVKLTQDEAEGIDGFVAHHDENGQLVRVLHAAGPGYQSIETLAAGHSGDVFVAGSFSSDQTVLGEDTVHARGRNTMFVAKYSATALSSEPQLEFPSEAIEAANHPNPFQRVTTITYNVPVPGRVRLTVYDILGRELAVLVDEQKSAGSHSAWLDASAWPSGTYLYRLEVGSQVEKGRLVRWK